jgi:hypothetical protein
MHLEQPSPLQLLNSRSRSSNDPFRLMPWHTHVRQTSTGRGLSRRRFQGAWPVCMDLLALSSADARVISIMSMKPPTLNICLLRRTRLRGRSVRRLTRVFRRHTIPAIPKVFPDRPSLNSLLGALRFH